MKKKLSSSAAVRVECYRMSPRDVADLEDFLSVAEGIENIGHVSRKSSGAIEFGHLFIVNLPTFFAGYAGGRVLDYVYDEIASGSSANAGSRPSLLLSWLGLRRRRRLAKDNRSVIALE